ncbi:BPI fold-containing family B member 6 [Pluvialis apricaria]
MSGIWCVLFLGGWLAWSGGAEGPGDVIRIDLGTIDRAVSTALNESHVLQKMAEEAVKKKPNAKPIKGISGLKVKDLHPPVISLVLLPGSGLFMAVLVHMTIAGKSMLPKVMSKFLNSTLQKVLPSLLCPAVDAVLNLVNAKFTTMTSEIPLGTAGTLQYVLLNPPMMNETFIELDLKTILHQDEGKEVDLPMDQPSLSSLPPKRDAATQLILSANFLSAELSILQASFNLNISNNTVLWLPPLVTTMVGALIPEISSMLPPSQPVLTEMREAKAPVVTITPDKSFVQLFSAAEFWISPSDSAPESLFILDVDSNLEAEFAIAEEKLRLSLVLQSLSRVALASSSLGMFDMSWELPLKGVLADIIHVAYVPSINRALRGGVPLPDLLGITYQRANISGFEKQGMYQSFAVNGPRGMTEQAKIALAQLSLQRRFPWAEGPHLDDAIKGRTEQNHLIFQRRLMRFTLPALARAYCPLANVKISNALRRFDPLTACPDISVSSSIYEDARCRSSSEDRDIGWREAHSQELGQVYYPHLTSRIFKVVFLVAICSVVSLEKMVLLAVSLAKTVLWAVSLEVMVLWAVSLAKMVLWAVSWEVMVLWAVSLAVMVLWAVSLAKMVLWAVSWAKMVLLAVSLAKMVLLAVSLAKMVLWAVS